MAVSAMGSSSSLLLLLSLFLIFCTSPAHAFGAGNIGTLFGRESLGKTFAETTVSFYFEDRGSQLAAWRHRGHAQDAGLHQRPQVDVDDDQTCLLR